MRRYLFALPFVLFITCHAKAQDAPDLTLRDQLDRPYLALYQLQDLAQRPGEVESLRSAVRSERQQHIQACRAGEKQLEQNLETARKGLKALNAASPRDTRTMAAARLNLHTEITALEHNLRNKTRECECDIPAAFEIKLAKVDLLERWPQQRAETAGSIEDGAARRRKFGDIDDIGFRKLTADQEKDILVGEQAVRQMAASGFMPPEIRDASVQRYIQDLGAKIARNSDLKVPLRVTLLDTPEVNATALPGGFLFLTSGMFLACETEAELAAVMGQQIAHIAARHGTRASKRSILSKMFVPAAQIATGLFTGGVSNAGALYGMDFGFQGLGIVTERTLAGSNDKAQRDADQLGIQYAWNAGFDPRGFISFLDSIAKQNDYSRTGRLVMTKPPLGERLLAAFTEIQFLPQKEYTVDSREFRTAKILLRP
jgi:hypothetical protein